MKTKPLTLSLSATLSFFSADISKTNAQPLPIASQKTIGCSGIETANCFIIDHQGNYVIAGTTSDSCSLTGPYFGRMDAWIIKLDSAGNKIWSATAGGDSADALGKIKQTADGGYIAVGSTVSNIGSNIVNKGHDDYWAVKTDANGNILWQKNYGGSGSDIAFDVVETKGGYLIAGTTTSSNGDVTNFKGGPADAWLIRIDLLGNLIWQKTYGSSGADNYFIIQQTPDSNFLLAGKVGSSDHDVTAPVNGVDAIFLQKMDTAGNILWTKNYGGSVFQTFGTVFQDPNGGYLLGAKTTSSDLDVSSNHGGYDLWAIRTNDTGKIIWQKTYGGTKDDDFSAIVKSKEGGYLFLGGSFSNDFDATGNHSVYADVLAIKVNDTGAVEWSKMYGGSSGEGPCDAYQLSDSSYIFAATSSSHDGDVQSNIGVTNVWIPRLKKVDSTNLGMLNLNNNSEIKVFPTIANDLVTVEIPKDFAATTFRLFDLAGKEINVPFFKSNSRIMFHTTSLPSGMYLLRVTNRAENKTFKIIRAE